MAKGDGGGGVGWGWKEAGELIWTRTLWDDGQDEPVPAEESSGVAPEPKLQNKTKDRFFFFFPFFFLSSNSFYAGLTQIW